MAFPRAGKFSSDTETSVVFLSIMEGLDSAVIVSLQFFLHGVEAAEVV